MSRETFGSRFGLLMTMIGVAVGLGNVWRFPYMVGKFGGAAFVVLYVIVVIVIGVPGLMAEWALGRHTRRGTVGAFEAGGLPGGKAVGWGLFAVVVAATGYYTNVLGWVLYYTVGFLIRPLGVGLDPGAILPPATGFDARSFGLQLVCTAAVIWLCAVVLLRGLRQGIERASVLIMPMLYLILIAVIVRALTLPGARAGIDWYILKFSPGDITAAVAVAAMGQAIFSLSLGGTFMVAYGSYLATDTKLGVTAVLTAIGDTMAGLLAGLAIFPAVFAFGLEPGSGPSLLFSTLPETFGRMPAGWLFGALFFAALFGAAYLSDVAALEVLIAGLTDNTKMNRRRAVWTAAGAVFLASIPPMINLRVFVPWDLTFGSGMQTLGALLAAITLGWCVNRSQALAQLPSGSRPLYYWIRFAIPAAILSVATWWLSTEVLK